MSKRTYIRLAAGAALAVVLCGSAQATRPDVDRDRELDERELLVYILPAPAPPPAQWAFLQDGPAGDEGSPRGPRGRPRRPGRRFNGPPPDGQPHPPLPPRLVERLRAMTPEQRERVLQNNPRFRELPPARRSQLLDRLNTLLEMNDSERRDLDQRLSVFRNLSPEQRRRARQIYENHWRTLPPGRRMAILDEFRSLRDMSADERDKRMSSDEYQTQFSSEERKLLEELSSL